MVSGNVYLNRTPIDDLMDGIIVGGTPVLVVGHLAPIDGKIAATLSLAATFGVFAYLRHKRLNHEQ